MLEENGFENQWTETIFNGIFCNILSMSPYIGSWTINGSSMKCHRKIVHNNYNGA